jgi:hypothetical protein
VVEPDRGDHGEGRGEHVGRVETPAQAGFDHRQLDALLGEGKGGHGEARLEERARRARRRRDALDADECLLERLGRGDPAADPDALGEVDEVGRGEEAGADPGRAQDPFEDGRGRALAVRARDVEGGEGLLGVAEPVEERARAGQAEARLAALETVEALERRPVRVARDQGR